MIKRAYHAIVEDAMTFALLEKKVFHIVNSTKSTASRIDPPESSLESAIVLEDHISLHNTGFSGSRIFSLKFELPPPPAVIGFDLRNDLIYNLPYYVSCLPRSFAHNTIPAAYRNNMFIININADCMLTAEYVQDKLKFIQLQKDRTVTIDVVPQGSRSTQTSLSMSRAIFDQIPTIHHNRPVITALNVPSTHSHFVRSPSKPPVPKSFYDALKTSWRREWKQAAWIAFKKNKNIAAFTLPFPSNEKPENTTVFRTLLVCEWKETECPTIWEPRVRECIIGTPQKQYVDFDNSY